MDLLERIYVWGIILGTLGFFVLAIIYIFRKLREEKSDSWFFTAGIFIPTLFYFLIRGQLKKFALDLSIFLQDNPELASVILVFSAILFFVLLALFKGHFESKHQKVFELNSKCKGKDHIKTIADAVASNKYRCETLFYDVRKDNSIELAYSDIQLKVAFEYDRVEVSSKIKLLRNDYIKNMLGLFLLFFIIGIGLSEAETKYIKFTSLDTVLLNLVGWLSSIVRFILSFSDSYKTNAAISYFEEELLPLLDTSNK